MRRVKSRLDVNVYGPIRFTPGQVVLLASGTIVSCDANGVMWVDQERPDLTRWERIAQSGYLTFGICTVHRTWPWLRPPQVDIVDTHPSKWFRTAYILCCGLMFQPLIPGWRSVFILPLLLFSIWYRRALPGALAQKWRERIHGS